VTDPAKRLKILFLCTGNACRSQMAEGWARHLRGDRLEPYSAGIEPPAKGSRFYLPLACQAGRECAFRSASYLAATSLRWATTSGWASATFRLSPISARRS